ncbi:hypothetical protein QBC38DRAFT_219258 [Podospora fimiseda]|uniref:DUF7580 domain-containing protein n=1 Tax=Podospora fimiseda TaxID=252190 RepID=A0AAN7H3H8_9PEZI|nr:hypothetical protein QBC38DRAFT_219258 [Podospora fimiseda]
MEPVSLALGVLPLLGAGFKGYKAIREKTNAYRNYFMHAAQRIQGGMVVQQTIYTNEARLLLRFVLNEDGNEAEKVLQTLQSGGSDEHFLQSIEDAMKSQLAESYEACKVRNLPRSSVADKADFSEVTIANISETLTSLQGYLDNFITGTGVASDRLRDRAGFALKYSEKSEELISLLRNYNSDLSRLREQITREISKRQPSGLSAPQEFALPAQTFSQQPQKHHDMPAFDDVQNAMNAFHRCLTEMYMHVEPSQKPGVTAEGAESRQFRIKLFSELTLMGLDHAVRSNFIFACYCPSHYETIKTIHLSVCSTLSNSKNTSDSHSRPPTGSTSSSISNNDLLDLTHPTECLYTEFNQRIMKSKLLVGSSIGTVGAMDGLEHSFFPPEHVLCEPNTSASNFSTLRDLLALYEAKKHLPVPDQLRLAKSVVSTVLKFHQTPWLREYWTNEDLRFINRAKDLQTMLRSLHLDADIRHSNSQLTTIPNTQSMAMEITNPWEDAMLEYGVRNLTLFNLGIILLQIGRWGQIPEHDIKEIRRLARELTPLGPKYKDLTLKCLNCDFGHGDSLENPELQQAVYKDVVCGLENIINRLESRRQLTPRWY